MSTSTSPFEIKQCSEFGRVVIAAKNFEMGELIFEEAPLLLSPSDPEESEETENNDVSLVTACVGCCKVITDLTRLCSHCRWPICSERCEMGKFHASYECVVFKIKNIAPSKKAFSLLHVIRASIMYKYKQISTGWKEFTSLTSKMDIKTDSLKAAAKKEIREATSFINDVCQLNVDFSTVGIILRTFTLNAFTMDEGDENGEMYNAAVLYKIGCLFSHSCYANAEWIILPSNQNDVKRWCLRIYARRNIFRNEIISISYIQDNLASDTSTRQQIILRNCHFYCRCQRCADRSEFGYYTSAVKCKICGATNLTQDEPSDEYSTWTCIVCETCKGSWSMKFYVEDYEKDLKAVMANQGLADDKKSGLEELIISSEARYLSENHRAVTRAIYYWLKCQDFKDLLEFSMDSQQRFIKIMQRAAKCLKMFRMFVTVHYIVAVELVFSYAISSFYFKTENFSSINYDNYSREEKRQIISAIYDHLKIAVEIILWHPHNPVHSSFRDTALSCFMFWRDQFDAIKENPSNGVHGSGTMIVFDQMKTSLGKFWAQVRRLIGAPTKPDVSLLRKYDFYFKN